MNKKWEELLFKLKLDGKIDDELFSVLWDAFEDAEQSAEEPYWSETSKLQGKIDAYRRACRAANIQFTNALNALSIGLANIEKEDSE